MSSWPSRITSWMRARETSTLSPWKKARLTSLNGRKPVPFVAVIDERGFQAGLDAGDYALVDVSFTLLSFRWSRYRGQ